MGFFTRHSSIFLLVVCCASSLHCHCVFFGHDACFFCFLHSSGGAFHFSFTFRLHFHFHLLVHDCKCRCHASGRASAHEARLPAAAIARNRRENRTVRCAQQPCARRIPTRTRVANCRLRRKHLSRRGAAENRTVA